MGNKKETFTLLCFFSPNTHFKVCNKNKKHFFVDVIFMAKQKSSF
jgi:hypothetical protein